MSTIELEAETEGRHRAPEGGLSTMEMMIYRPPLWSLPAGRDWLAQLAVSVVAGGAVTALVMATLIAAMDWALGVRS